MVIPTASDGAYLARHVGLKVGMKVSTPALTINRLCGSGFQSIVGACQEIKVGDSSVVLTGGAENMSMAPYVLRTRFGAALGQTPQMEDSLWDTLTDKHAGCPMAITAENLAEKYGITRQECDAYALRSQVPNQTPQANERE
jgi:acetyl-CoA acetyltransferase